MLVTAFLYRSIQLYHCLILMLAFSVFCCLLERNDDGGGGDGG